LLEPQNIEQGMSKEEGHELTDQIATKNAKIQESYETANARDRNVSNHTSRVFLRLFVATPSFFLRHSLFDLHLFVFRWSRILARKTSFHAFVEQSRALK